jgi:hypothetical protein
MKGKKTVTLSVSIWAERKKPNQPITIKLASKDRGIITTFKDVPGSLRTHTHGFGKFKKVLQEEGCWPLD